MYNVYFAFGCEVFNDPKKIEAYIALTGETLGVLNGGKIDENTDFGRRLLADKEYWQTYADAGTAKSKEPGACQYWHEHPDEVALAYRLFRPPQTTRSRRSVE
jgi:hypothetical protein